jgi:hypothetical protein
VRAEKGPNEGNYRRRAFVQLVVYAGERAEPGAKIANDSAGDRDKTAKAKHGNLHCRQITAFYISVISF